MLNEATSGEWLLGAEVKDVGGMQQGYYVKKKAIVVSREG